MYKSLFLTLILISCAALTEAQISEGGKPYSNYITALKNTAAYTRIDLKELDIKGLLEQEAFNPGPEHYGVFTDTVIDIKVSGKADNISSLGRIWRLRIGNVNARSIQLSFKKFVIPDGAKLFVYNSSKTVIAGAFTRNNVQKDSTFTDSRFYG